MGTSGQHNVFVWNNYRSWRGVILRLLADLIDQSVFVELKRHPPRYFVSDDLSWLDDAIECAKGVIQPEIWATLIERLPHRYQFIRAFHGCRTHSTQSYLEHGVQPSDPSVLNRIAFEIFSCKERVEAAIEDLAKKDGGMSYQAHNRGKVFFCLQLEHLIEECGHYLLYGSEYLLCVANCVGEPDVLRRRGRATVIECNVPICDIPEAYIRDLTGRLMCEIFEKHCDPTYRTRFLNFGFPIATTLVPENVVGFHFPTRILNPHKLNQRED